MQQLTPRIVAILQKYMRDPHAPVENSTTFAELEIDGLDLPMIFLDVEDNFDVQIEYNDEIEDFSTVGSLIVLVEARLEAKTRPRTPIRRPKRSWMSTGAERRR
jgi:acyl carrier protein